MKRSGGSSNNDTLLLDGGGHRAPGKNYMSFEEVKDYRHLMEEGRKCCNNGRWKASVQAFEMTILRQTARNKRRLETGTYKPYKTNDFQIRERGKWRLIRAHKIQDRQVYKSFCKYELKPQTDGRIMASNSASQIAKGTDHSIEYFRKVLAKAVRKWGRDFYVVTYDDHDYFGSLPHKKIVETIVLSDQDTRKLLEQYVDIFPGEAGIGIGGEPSQDIAVIYQSKVDRMVACDKAVLGSGRYMDDGFAVVHAREDAERILREIIEKSEEIGLVVNMKRTKISYMARDTVVWLKKRTRIDENGKIVMQLTRKNVRDEIRNIKRQKELITKGEMPKETAFISIECWLSYANKYNSRQQVVRVLNVFMEEFGVPWEIAKILLRRNHRQWLNKCRAAKLL